MARIESTVAYLNAPRQLEFRSESLDSGNVAAGQVLCETLVTAISPGTELAAYVGLPALREGTGYPRLQGYCNVARVLAVGVGVSHIRPGQRVLSFASHRSHFSMPADDVLQVLADEAASEDMACAYLFHLGYNAVLRSAIRPGSRVLVIGLGVLGLTSVALAAIAGARVVGVSDHLLPQRLGLEFGARAILSRADERAIRSALTADLADVVITTSMDWGSDWQLALQLAGHHATIACLGASGQEPGARGLQPARQPVFLRQTAAHRSGRHVTRAAGASRVSQVQRARQSGLRDCPDPGRTAEAGRAVVSSYLRRP